MIEQKKLKLMTATLAGMVLASAALSEEPTSRTIAEPGVGKASCEEVTWQKDVLARYPRIAEACQEVVVSNGTKWARFTGNFVRRTANGDVTTTIEDRQGATMGELIMHPAAGQRVLLNGDRRPFSELRRGQQISLYVPESRFAAATEPGVPDDQLAPIVLESVSIKEPASPQVAAAPMRTRMPATGGPLPLVLLGGLAALAGGMTLTFGRLRSRRT